MQRRTFAALAVAMATFATPFAALAQASDFPNKPVRLVVPYAPGGLPDTVARIVAQKLSERLRQPVVVENKPGGNGVVSVQTLMSAPSDGYSFIVSDGSMLSITPQINKSAKYAVGQDLMAVSLIARSPLFLVAHPKSGVQTFKDFIAQAKAKPGMLTYGSSGIGSTHHLTMEALKAALGLDVRHIPFRGSGQSVPALVGGQVDFLFAALPSMLGFVKSGQVTLLASNAPRRSAQVPDVPAIAEVVPGFDFSVAIGVLARAGTPAAIVQRMGDEISEVVSGFDFSVAIGVLARAGTPAAIVQRMGDEISAVVKLPDVIEKFQVAGIEPSGAGAEAYRKTIEAENAAMATAGRHADLKSE